MCISAVEVDSINFFCIPMNCYSPESDWPQIKLQDDIVTQPIFTTTDKERTTTLKVDSTILHTNAIVEREKVSTKAKKEPIIDFSRCFHWFHLLRATARVVQFKDILQQKRKLDLRIDDREMAKTLLYYKSQHALFPATFKYFTTNKALNNKNALLAYSTFRDGYFIRARGRLRNSPMPDATK